MGKMSELEHWSYPDSITYNLSDSKNQSSVCPELPIVLDNRDRGICYREKLEKQNIHRKSSLLG